MDPLLRETDDVGYWKEYENLDPDDRPHDGFEGLSPGQALWQEFYSEVLEREIIGDFFDAGYINVRRRQLSTLPTDR